MHECQARPAIDQTAYMDAWKIYHKTACTSLPEDEHLDVRNMSKTLEGKGKVYPCTGTEALYRPYGP